MSPAPVEKRLKEIDHCPAWSQPIDLIGLNASIPRTAGNFQRQLTPIQRALYFSIKGARNSNRDARKSQERGADVFKGPGYGALARTHNVDRKTAYRNVKILGDKGWAFAFERTGPKGEREGTWYVIPPWRDVLAAQAANPQFAKATVNGKTRIVVIGRARRFMTVIEESDGYVVAMNPKNGERWRLRLDQVPDTAELPDVEDESSGEETSAPPAAAEPVAEAIDVLLLTLNEVCTTGADERDRVAVTKKATKANRDREIPDEAIAQMVREIGRDSKKATTRSVGFILDRIGSKVHKWRNNELQRAAEEARAASAKAQYEARQREESIELCTRLLADPQTTDAERVQYEELLAYWKAPPTARAG